MTIHVQLLTLVKERILEPRDKTEDGLMATYVLLMQLLVTAIVRVLQSYSCECKSLFHVVFVF